MMTANNCSVSQVALILRRAPSTITRELVSFGARPDLPASMAGAPAENGALPFGEVQHFLAQG